MAPRKPTVESDPGKARKRAVGVALVGVMGAALAYEGLRTTQFGGPTQAVEIFPDQAECGRRRNAGECERAFALARRAHDAHAARESNESACLAAWERCEPYSGGYRPAMAAVGVARDGRRLIARALARPRNAAPGDYTTTGVGDATDPARSGGSSSSGGGSSHWGASSSSSSTTSDRGVATYSGGGEHVSSSGAGSGGAAHGVARGGFGGVGHGFSAHGG